MAVADSESGPAVPADLFLFAPAKRLCRCLESPLERGCRHIVCRVALVHWLADMKKTLQVKAALKRMTPEGRAVGAAYRAWHAKLLEFRRMKAALALISPTGRSMCATPLPCGHMTVCACD